IGASEPRSGLRTLKVARPRRATRGRDPAAPPGGKRHNGTRPDPGTPPHADRGRGRLGTPCNRHDRRRAGRERTRPKRKNAAPRSPRGRACRNLAFVCYATYASTPPLVESRVMVVIVVFEQTWPSITRTPGTPDFPARKRMIACTAGPVKGNCMGIRATTAGAAADGQPAPSSAARTAAACPCGVTLGKTFAIRPSSLMMKVVRSTPQNVRPYTVFSFQTPYASATALSVSERSRKLRPYLSRNLRCDSTESGLTPRTTAPPASI